MTTPDSVGIVGAGVSGLVQAIQFQRAGVQDVVLYEREGDVGGTWLVNTYPGLHCDIPSHLYSYSFEPNPEWSHVYADRAEIQAYLRSCAERYGLIDRIRFGTTVEQARYDEEAGVWELQLGDGNVARHRVLIGATGGLTAPRFPRIGGLDSFGGPLWHSATWDHTVDLAGARVAVVGSAASAVQVVPAVAERAAEVVVFSRTPNWVMPRNNRSYTDAERTAFRQEPATLDRVRREQYHRALLWHRAFRRDQVAIGRLRQTGLDHMRRFIDDPAVVAALTPDYDPGCRRILVSDDYYRALAQPHVTLVPRGVERLTATSVVADDGTDVEVDAVVFCTGYRLGGRADGTPAMELVGRGGRRWVDVVAERAAAYRGVATPGFPNYFTVVGINAAVGYTAVFASAEVCSEFITRVSAPVLAGQRKSVEARADATLAYTDSIQAQLADMSWTGNCTNFYRDAQGRVVTFYPGTVGQQRRDLATIVEDDWISEGF